MFLRTCTAILALYILSPERHSHAENWLQGQVFENHDSTMQPAAGAEVSIVNIGNPYSTGPDGGYRVLVPDTIHVGQTITLYIKHRGWTIDTPIGGKLNLPNSFKQDIVLLPGNSQIFLSPARLQILIDSIPDKLRDQVKLGGNSGDTDPAQVLKHYAAEHHIREVEVFEKVEALIRQYERSTEPYKHCLALIYRKKFDQATTTCHKATTSRIELLKQKQQEIEDLLKLLGRSEYPFNKDSVIAGMGSTWPSASTEELNRFVTAIPVWSEAKTVSWSQLITNDSLRKSLLMQLEEAKRQMIMLTEEVVGGFKATGDTYYANYQFTLTIEAYIEGLSYVETKKLPTLWADMQWRTGMANWQIGIRSNDADKKVHLARAEDRLSAAQTVYTKTDFPDAWAAIEKNLDALRLSLPPPVQLHLPPPAPTNLRVIN